jgi:hypothetical protein
MSDDTIDKGDTLYLGAYGWLDITDIDASAQTVSATDQKGLRLVFRLIKKDDIPCSECQGVGGHTAKCNLFAEQLHQEK